jgi:arginyl-tRNA--protein-N-Asp/Glu arginylyltransferase
MQKPMNMDNNKRDLVNNEKLRLQIRYHPNFHAWYESRSAHARMVFEMLMEDDATPEAIEAAREASDEDWDDNDFLHVLGGGNPDPMVALALTNVVLDFLRVEIENPE